MKGEPLSYYYRRLEVFSYCTGEDLLFTVALLNKNTRSEIFLADFLLTNLF